MVEEKKGKFKGHCLFLVKVINIPDYGIAHQTQCLEPLGNAITHVNNVLRRPTFANRHHPFSKQRRENVDHVPLGDDLDAMATMSAFNHMSTLIGFFSYPSVSI